MFCPKGKLVNGEIGYVLRLGLLPEKYTEFHASYVVYLYKKHMTNSDISVQLSL